MEDTNGGSARLLETVEKLLIADRLTGNFSFDVSLSFFDALHHNQQIIQTSFGRNK